MSAAVGVVRAAMERAGTVEDIVAALEAAGLVQSPETAAELAAYRALKLGAPEGRVSATCGDPWHPTWLRTPDDTQGCPWCQVRELADVVAGTGLALYEEELDTARLRVAAANARRRAARLRRRVAELEAERHSTNEALSDAAEALRANRDRIAGPDETHTGCGMPLTRRLECGHCPHEVCEDCDRCPCSCRCGAAPSSQTAAEVLAERSTPWVGVLPAEQAMCRCGHTGADHHHAGRSCGATLPRRQSPGAPWGPLEPCTCREFAGGPSRGELAEQRHLLDPLDHRMERLAPGQGVTA